MNFHKNKIMKFLEFSDFKTFTEVEIRFHIIISKQFRINTILCVLSNEKKKKIRYCKINNENFYVKYNT